MSLRPGIVIPNDVFRVGNISTDDVRGEGRTLYTVIVDERDSDSLLLNHEVHFIDCILGTASELDRHVNDVCIFRRVGEGDCLPISIIVLTIDILEHVVGEEVESEGCSLGRAGVGGYGKILCRIQRSVVVN